MECVALIAGSAAVIFARLALMQGLNPLVWGVLALAVYIGAPTLAIYQGATWYDAPWVWLSSFGGLFVLFVLQCVIAERKRYQGRSGPKKPTPKSKKGRR